MTIVPLEILKISEGYNTLCRIHIRNKEYRMLVDTGASLSMFDIKKSKKLSDNKIIENDNVSAGFGGDKIESKSLLMNEMVLGDIIINDYNMMLIDFNNLNSYFKINGFPLIDGIIGGDILFKYKAIIDYNKRELILN